MYLKPQYFATLLSALALFAFFLRPPAHADGQPEGSAPAAPVAAPPFECTDAVDVPVAECDDLLEIYRLTVAFRNWDAEHLENWLTPEVCTWAGVTCRDEHVTEIDLSGRSMRERPDILTRGTPLDAIAPRLEVLRAERSGLAGGVPRLQNFPRLVHLDLSHNELEGIAEAVGDERYRVAFDVGLDANANGGIETRLGALEHIDLSHNKLFGMVTADVRKFENLVYLDLSGNEDLSGPMPRAFMQLEDLTTLRFNGTGMCESADDEWNAWAATLGLYAGTFVNCGDAYCTDGSLVAGLGGPACRAIVDFFVHTEGSGWTRRSGWFNPEFVAPVCDWYGVWCDENKQVISLSVRNNDVRGELPASLSDIATLQNINVNHNAVGGTIPRSLEQLPALRAIEARSNRMNGPLPAWLLDVPSLRVLILGANGFAGTTDLLAGGHPDLEMLDLASNEIEGELGPWVQTFPRLTTLDLSDNEIHGQLPPELGQLPLEYLRLGRNKFSGRIPEEFGQLRRLLRLELQDNVINGNVPASLGDLSRLYRLRVDGNEWMGGCLPFELQELEAMEEIRFDGTNLQESRNPRFQQWLRGVGTVSRSEQFCDVGETLMCFDLVDIEAGPYVGDEEHFMFSFLEQVAGGGDRQQYAEVPAYAFDQLNWNGPPNGPVRGPNGVERWRPVRVTCDDIAGSDVATTSQLSEGEDVWSPHLPGMEGQYYLYVDGFELDWLSHEAVSADGAITVPRPAPIPEGQLGDLRRYGNGTVEVRNTLTDQAVLSFTSLDLMLSIAYPHQRGITSPIGAGGADGTINGEGRGRIDHANSFDTWADLLDPHGNRTFGVTIESFDRAVHDGMCYAPYTARRMCIRAPWGDPDDQRPPKAVRLDGPAGPINVTALPEHGRDRIDPRAVSIFNENDQPVSFAVQDVPQWMEMLDVAGEFEAGATTDLPFYIKGEFRERDTVLRGHIVLQTSALEGGGYVRIPVEVRSGVEEDEPAAFSWQDLTVRPGSEVRIPIYFSPAVEWAHSFQLQMQFDMSYLQFSHFQPSDGTKGYAFSAEMDAAGMLTVAAYDESGGSHPIASPTTLGHIVMKTEASAPTDGTVAYGMMLSGSAGDISGKNIPVVADASMLITASSEVQLGGQLYYFGTPTGETASEALAISNVKVGLFGTDSTTPLQLATTDEFGRYAFTAAVDGAYTVRPVATSDPRAEAALTAADAYTTLYAATGGIDFVEWTYRKIGDVNASAALDATDAYVTMSRVLGSIPDLSRFGLGDWAFVPASYEHDGSDWTKAPSSITIARAETSDLSLDFRGGFYGDVNASGLDAATKSIATLGLPDTTVVAGAMFTLPLHVAASEEAVGAFEVELTYDPALFAFDGAEATTDGWSVSAHVAEDGVVRVAGYERTGTKAGVIAGEAAPARLRFRALAGDGSTKTATLGFRGAAHLGNAAGADRLAETRSASVTIGTSVANEKAGLPESLALAPAFPNPFGLRTTIGYDVPEAASVRLAVYDVLGREVAVLVDETRPAGRHTAEFEASGLSSGLYLVRLTAGGHSATQRITLAR